MTRETKIGLLIGLGFIVVFAVLLSHTGQVPVAGDERGLVLAEGGSPGGGLPEAGDDAYPQSDTLLVPDGLASGELTLSDMIEGSPAEEGSWDRELPRIDVLEPQPRDAAPPVRSDHVLLVGTSAVPSEGNRVIPVRVAPPPMPVPVLEEPAPSGRPASPKTSPDPKSQPDPVAPPARTRPKDEYLVQKGDSLGVIAQQVYGTSRPPVVAFLAEANKERIKSKDLVFAGQKLVILELPPRLVEHVEFAPASVHKAVDAARPDRSARDEGAEDSPPVRRAPKPALELVGDGGPGRDAGHRADPAPRWYVVQPNDTLTSIARQQLGSSDRWREIHALNRHIEPTKMKPGVKIKLPEGESTSEAAESRRASV